MRIFLDNREIQMDKKEMSIALLTKEITSLLAEEGKLLYDIYVDGKILYQHDNIHIDSIGTIEFMSKSPRMILLESLYDVEDFVDKFLEVVGNIEDELSMGDDTSAVNMIFELINGLEWVFNLLYSLKENTAIDYKLTSFNNYYKEFKSTGKELIEGYGSERYLAVLKICEYKMTDLLLRLKEDIPSYRRELINELTVEKRYN